MKKTKIVCTIGPASEGEEVLREMFKAGLNVCRLNFSHGSYEEHKKRAETIKKIRKELNLPIAILLDTKGPEIRLGEFKEQVEIKKNQKFILTTRDVIGTNEICSVSYKNLPCEIKPENRILINDGLLELRVREVLNDTDIECFAVNSGTLTSRKGVNLPNVKINLPYINEKDILDIEFAIKNDFDFIAASFTRTAYDVMQVKDLLKKHNSKISVIAKIENQEGIDNIDSILDIADGIMVARGDLGVEVLPEKIPHIQKKLIQKANLVGKPVITATQMLESMTFNLRPTRAEVTDVANAIVDGTSAVMLSGETAVGNFPVETVKMMNSIAIETENNLDYSKLFIENKLLHSRTVTNAISEAACSVAESLNANVIVTGTSSGVTPRAVAKFKPSVPIIAVTDSEYVMRQLSLDWDVYPILSLPMESTDDVFEICMNVAKHYNYVKEGDLAILTAGIPIGKAGSTNLLKVEIIS